MSEIAERTISSVEMVIRLLIQALSTDLSSNHVTGIETSFKNMEDCLLVAEREESRRITRSLAWEIQNVSVEIEVVLDKLMLHAPRHILRNRLFKFIYNAGHNVKHWRALRSLESEIRNIQQKIQEIKNSQDYSELIRSQSGRSEELDYRLTPEILEDYEIIGMDETKKKLSGQLIANDHYKRLTVAIVGPLGSGKTVLANNIFRSYDIQLEFECCAWITVPPTVGTGDIPPGDLVIFEMGKSNEQRIPITGMARLLKERRYLVVVDDISDEKQWQKIEQELPNELCSSRVLVTTIDSQVAKAVAGSPDLIHQVDDLGEKHSWNLFCQKAFRSRNGECPQDLIDIGKTIVGRCGYIPQAIVEAGNLLARKDSIKRVWTNVGDDLFSKMKTISGNEALAKKLLRRYKDLPSNHQKCFLYFSMFPKYCRVSRARLIRLWIAEGFIEKTGKKSNLEETAENYLDVLIARNLVQSCERNCEGRVISCCVRYLVHEFCVMKSKEKKFCAVLTNADSQNSLEIHRRLSLHSFNLERITGKTNHVRSLIAFGYDQTGSPQINVMTNELELLAVLDLQDTPILQYPPNISNVILLRYLSLRGTIVRKVPTTIHELHHLEYLDLKHTFVTELPGGVCTLENLSHLLVCSKPSTSTNTRDYIQGAEVRGSIRPLQSLRKLALIKAKDRRFMTELGSLTQLEKLGLVDIRKEDGKYLCKSIEEMPNLSVLNLRSVDDNEYLDLDYMEKRFDKLQCLYLKGRLRKLPCWINKSLSSVTRIKLELSRLNKCPLLEVLQDLPHLIELRMVESFCEEALVFETEGFQELKTLHIERFSELNVIYIAENSMPNLQDLTITNCQKLMTLPVGIHDLSRLKKLHVFDMNHEFTSKLEACSEDYWMVKHIADIKARNGSGC